MSTATIDLGDGTAVDAVVGYRTWVPCPRGGEVRLRSLYVDYYWPIGTATARCRCKSRRNPILPSDYQTPIGTHTCGIYAYDRRGEHELHAHLQHQVSGEVALWGDVHIHERGYRGQFARILALHTRSTLSMADSLLTEVAAQTYNVPLVLVDAD